MFHRQTLYLIVPAFITVVVGLTAFWHFQGDVSKKDDAESPQSNFRDTYMPFYAANFLVETNPTGPHPLVVHVSGGLADSCYRLRLGLVNYWEQEIDITLYMGSRVKLETGCDAMIHAIMVSIPIDVAALAPGDYTLNVMGQTQIVTITPAMQATASAFDTRTTGLDIDKIRYLPVGAIENQPAVQIRGRYTIDCPYIIGVVQQTHGNRITVIPHAAVVESKLMGDTDCRENLYESPETMPLTIPLDLNGLPLGEYTLTVGDQSLKFDLATAPTPIKLLPANWMTPITEPPANPFWLPVN